MQIFFDKGLGNLDPDFNDFEHSPGHVLSYVFLHMKQRWEQLPPESRLEAQQGGVRLLIDAILAWEGFCDTRAVGEMLQVVTMKFSTEEHERENRETLEGKALDEPVGIPDEQVMDFALLPAREILSQLLRKALNDEGSKDASPEASDEALQQALYRQLVERMASEHPGITVEQLDRYMTTNVVPGWDSFKESALELKSQGKRPDVSGS